MHVNESSENYLETILMLSKKLPVVRAVDIATELNFKKSSVSVAMKKLRESEHIIVSREGYITLTESGQAIADMIYERHTLLSSWLERLGVDPQVAADDACRMEHVISEESFNAIKKHRRYHTDPACRDRVHVISKSSGKIYFTDISYRYLHPPCKKFNTGADGRFGKLNFGDIFLGQSDCRSTDSIFRSLHQTSFT